MFAFWTHHFMFIFPCIYFSRTLDTWNSDRFGFQRASLSTNTVKKIYIEGILPKGPYPPCLRMEDRALLTGYPRRTWVVWWRSASVDGLKDFENEVWRKCCYPLMLSAFRPKQYGWHFCGDTFKYIFLNKLVRFSNTGPLKYVPMGSVDNLSALV